MDEPPTPTPPGGPPPAAAEESSAGGGAVAAPTPAPAVGAGAGKAAPKKKAFKVNRFDAKEKALLEAWYAEETKPKPHQCDEYAAELNRRRKSASAERQRSLSLTGKQIKFWFDHRRRVTKHGTYRPLKPGSRGADALEEQASLAASFGPDGLPLALHELPPAAHRSALHGSAPEIPVLGENLPPWINTIQLLPLLSQMVYKTYSAHDFLIREGERGEEMYFLLRGRVQVSQAGHQLAVLVPGSYFGEMGMLDRGPRTATVRALDDAHVFVLRGDEARGMLRSWPEISNVVVNEATTRLEELLIKSQELHGSAGSIQYCIADAHEIVIEEGDMTDDFYFLRSGEVGISKEGMTIATIQGGSFFGEMAAMVPGPRTSRVRALTRCELFKMPGHFLRAVFRADPSLQRTIGETLSSVASARVHDTLAALVHGSKSQVACQDLALAGASMRAEHKRDIFRLLKVMQKVGQSGAEAQEQAMEHEPPEEGEAA